MEGEGRKKSRVEGGREREGGRRSAQAESRAKNGDRGGWDGPRGVGGEG